MACKLASQHPYPSRSVYEDQLGLWLKHPYNVVNIVLAPLYGQNEHYGAEF